MKARVKVNNEIVDVHWSDDRECWHDRKKNKYYFGHDLEFLEEEIDWEQRRWDLVRDTFLKDRLEYSSPDSAAKGIVNDVDKLINEYKKAEL